MSDEVLDLVAAEREQIVDGEWDVFWGPLKNQKGEVILKDGETATEKEIQDYVRASMAKHKVPRYVEMVEAFPMNAAGKILKYKMREDAVEKLKLHKAASIETA